ncbi:hypothetical protein F2Q68_00001705 [Brassica cretica]|uniref:Uncharacterized protein n=1 Tax=Brassica cretica TaxID=69181 RepID=A0A8S9JPI3_BRACR|nr:hypothetical protein F2Q68_00001705 [Brassica cretica]
MNTHPDESLLSSPGASKETRRITVDGEDEPETNRSTLKLEPRNQSKLEDATTQTIGDEETIGASDREAGKAEKPGIVDRDIGRTPEESRRKRW